MRHFCQAQQTLELFFRERRHREPGLFQQRDIRESFVRLDRVEADRLFEGLHGHQIYARPIAIVGSRVGIEFFLNARQSDDLFVADAVIEEHEVALLHGAKIVSRLEIAHARPGRAAILEERGPRVGFRFLFHEPVILRHERVSSGKQDPEQWERETREARE